MLGSKLAAAELEDERSVCRWTISMANFYGG